MKKVGVAILGLGVVGGGVYEILTAKKEYFKKTQGLDISVESVLEKNIARAQALGIKNAVIAKSIEEVISNPAVDIVIEVIGGIEPARTFVLKALMSGKTVVTSNKELFAKHWTELEEEAKKMNAGLFFEASCVGGVPIIRVLQDGTLTLTLGRETDTGDRAGHTLKETDSAGVSREQLDAALKELRGDIYQSPPAFSAVKIPGKTGYEIVRTAEADELRERLVHVYRYEVTAFAPPKVALSFSATKGVSVRALARDLGQALGCGACVEDCRRTRCGKFSVDDAVPFVKMMDLHPTDLAARLIPKNRLRA